MPTPPAAERFAGVIFDLDGVLVESEHLWEANWVAVAGRHGYVWTAADTATCQGMSSREWSAYLAAKTGVRSMEESRGPQGLALMDEPKSD